MAFLTFPDQLTDEEKLLQQKYQKLKRKKKQVQALRAGPVAKVEPVPAPVPVKREFGPKADAKEVAKKLLKSGAISAIKVVERKDANFVRKRTASDRSVDRPGGYKPFSASESGESELLEEPFGAPADPNPAPSNRPDYASKFGDLYSKFVSAKDAETIAREETLRERKREGKAHYVNRDLPNQGNTVYVRGHGLTEPSLRSEFSQCGTVVQIVIESEKNCAFVTFESIEEANKAIDILNGSIIDNVQVQVSLARKQPVIRQQSYSAGTSEPASNNPSSSGASNSWTAIAANFYKENKDNKKGNDNMRVRRPAVVYDDVVE